MEKDWVLHNPCEKKAKDISEKYNVSLFLAKLLVNRGIENIDEFLHPCTGNLHSPSRLQGMDAAVERITKAIEEKEKILIFGDYDVDGITSTAVLYAALSKLEANLLYHIPIRSEGYGLKSETLEKYIAEGVSLVITVDCGISAVDEVDFLNSHKVDCIITDHHHPAEEYPKAYSIVNPKQQGCTYPFKELAGVGLALKLVHATYKHYGKENWSQFLDIVALGTVADLVPLIGENRTIVALGLQQMNENLRPNLKWLAEASGISYPIESYHLGFGFGPRLNAAGRVNDPNQALDLLLCDNEQQGMQIALSLNEQNKHRQELEKEIYEQAVKMVEEMDLADTKVIVIGDKSWHKGVIGIVASRIVEKFHRPVIILSIDEKSQIATGSSRSVEGFHLYDALESVSHLLTKFGGHAMAAGLSIEVDKINKFRQELNNYAISVGIDKYLTPKVSVDFTLCHDELSLSLIDEVELLKPFGQQNPAPVFAVNQLPVANYNLVGKEKNHLKISFNLKGNWINSIGFKKDYLVDTINGQDKINLLGYIEKNTFQGKTSLQLKILDIKSCKAEQNVAFPLDLRGVNVLKYIKESNKADQKYLLFTNSYHKDYLENFSKEFDNIVVLDYNEKPDFKNGIAILVDPPCTQKQFRYIISEIDKEKLIIGFRKEMVNLFPSKNFLRAIYTAIKRQPKQTADITMVLQYMNLNANSRYLALRGINILKEQGIIKENNGHFYLNDEGQSKVDIEQGSKYKLYKNQQMLYQKWFDYALTTSLDSLIKSQMFIDEEEKVWI
ncbi:single-stranded-DNA-specific exonuclease RecJ [Proteinivorax hydrogeniformans]|uniref:Single-stranded-DNA-specific exonuclease RecJ n=1 Tax=Proteinivorax hydrogeniformans TaxID=1826727 RepID=A0AAU8HSQ3_9FIRM